MIFDFFRKISTPLGVASITVLAILAFWLVNSHGVPGVPRTHVLNELGILDTTINYSPSLAYSLLAAYGEEGRYAYTAFLERVDFIFPVIYGSFFVMVTTFGFVRIFPGRPGVQKLALFPLATTLFDFAENCCFLVLLRNYPTRLDTVARVANICTLAKWGFALISTVLLLIALLGLLVTKILRREISQTS